jgi:hypothetical protein
VDGEAALVVEDSEAGAAGAADVVVDDELINVLLKEREGPATTTDLLALSLAEAGAESVAVGGIEPGGAALPIA